MYSRTYPFLALDNSPEAGLPVDTLFSFISENPIVAKLQYGLKITFIFILILFIDSVNRVYRVQIELSAVTENGKGYVLPDRSLCFLVLVLPSKRAHFVCPACSTVQHGREAKVAS